jgi:integrative and conjugative element protein (TIGR02256 family)
VSPETVQLHAALLSRSLQAAVGLEEAALTVWRSIAETGAIVPTSIALYPSWREERGGWTVLIDRGLIDAARLIRREHLPRETGGILLGSIDQYRRTIALVDVMPPPSDSIGTTASFERGTQGVPEAVVEASRRTAGIVGYVGEWHSHPPRVSVNMSTEDLRQLLHLTMHLGTDGDPSVMLIVGDADWSLIVGEVAQ